MMTQLDLFAAREPHPTSEANAVRLAEWLLREGGWRTRRQIADTLGMDDRSAREARQAAPDRIIFGQHGFRAIEHATADEIRACIATYESQARHMGEAAQRLRRAAHGRIG